MAVKGEMPTREAVVEDKPAISTDSISDPLKKMEMSLPFYRIDIADMLAAIKKAQTEGEKHAFVTLESLRKELKTDAWAPLADMNSPLVGVLLSDAFKRTWKDGDVEQKTGDEQIDADYLRIWSLLHCAGDAASKSIGLYDLLQDGGLQGHKEISANDKDLKPTFDKICRFVTADIIKFAAEIQGTSGIYTEEDVQKLIDDETIELVREEHWLNEVYDASSRLPNDAWL